MTLLKTASTSFIIILLFLMVSFSSKANHYLSKGTLKIGSFQDSTTTVLVAKNIRIKNYFQYIDSIVKHSNSINNYTITEHVLVRFNPWIINALTHTDYYRMIKKDSFVYDQKEMIVLNKGSEIKIPDSLETINLLNTFNTTVVDVNIPEFKLRIYEDSILLYVFPIRVGRNEDKYLEMSGRIQNLKTKTGKGTIVNFVKNPKYINPVNNHQYYETKRDDKKTTKLPQIPFIETEINGIRNGQLIHPTTNPKTLEKAYSNGCIGTKEADAWMIYYYAPIGTKVKIRYDLNILNNEKEKITLKDIYDFNND